MKSGPSDWAGFFVRETMESLRVLGVFRGSPHPGSRLHPLSSDFSETSRISARQVSAVELNSPQHLIAKKDSIMQKGKLGNLEVSAIGLGCMSTF
jgi:hypothetical protein